MTPPVAWEWLTWGVVGALLGAAINRATVVWRWFLPLPYGPWSPPAESGGRRTWFDRLPIVGWIALRRESHVHGRGYWIRPLTVELLAAIALPLFLHWSRVDGGLPTGWFAAANEADATAYWSRWGLWRFLAGVALLWGMAVATLIDFDEKTIPDQVTVSGTLLALLLAAVGIETRLPIAPYSTTGPWTVATADPPPFPALMPLTLASPVDHRWDRADYWASEQSGLGIALAVIVLWWAALLPKTVTWRYGVMKGIDLMVASVLRPARRRRGRLAPAPRRMRPLTRWVTAAGIAAAAIVAVGWWRGGDVREAMMSAIVGMAVGGGVVWIFRILAGVAMGREAMGFGDVTLMGMIGAFLGWQPSLMIFGMAPFTAIAVVVLQRLATREPEIAFGPYLCLAALIVMLRWNAIWNEWAADYLRLVGDMLIEGGVMGIVLAAFLLFGFGQYRRMADRAEAERLGSERS